MHDCVGNELHIGDRIVACDGYYSELLLGTVVRFTAHQVVCDCVRANHQNGEHFETRKYPNQLHLVRYIKLAFKRTFINESADHPYKDYYCSNCGNKDTVNEDDNFCSICGSKFITDKDLEDLCEQATRLIQQDITADKVDKETEEFIERIRSGELPLLNFNNTRGIDYINKGATGFKF